MNTSTMHANMMHHTRLTAGVAAAVLMTAGLGAQAQDEWPSETIEVISHASPGGGTDTTIRMWLGAAEESVDEDMVVVYRQGGGARAAHEYFVNRGPDGHTIMALTQTHLYTIARDNSPIEIDDMVGVVRAMDDPSVIVVRGGSDLQSYDDLLEASSDEALNWGVAQVGGTEHIGIARWAEAAGAEYRVVPFGSGGEMITALRSGAVDVTLANVSEALGAIEEGDLHPIALLDDERVGDLPDTPAVSEFDHNVTVTTTRGYAVHKDTPEEDIARIEELILNAMESENFHEYLRNAGLDPETSIAGREVWDAQLKEEYATSVEAMRKLDLIN